MQRPPQKAKQRPGFSTTQLNRIANPAMLGRRMEQKGDTPDGDEDGDEIDEEEEEEEEDDGEKDIEEEEEEDDDGEEDEEEEDDEEGDEDDEEEDDEEEDDENGRRPPMRSAIEHEGDKPEPTRVAATAAERAMEKARAIERLRRSKMRYGKDAEYSALITYTDEELPAMSTKQLLELDATLKHRLRSETSIKMYRRIVMQAVILAQGIVMTYPHVFKANLEGWKEEFWRDIDQMDHILFDIYDQYGDKAPDNPIFTLIMQVATHGMMFNITKQMVTAQQVQAQQPLRMPPPPQPVQPQQQQQQQQQPHHPMHMHTQMQQNQQPQMQQMQLPRMTQQQMLPMNMPASRLHNMARPPSSSLPPGARVPMPQIEEMPEPDLSQLPTGQLLAHLRQEHDNEQKQQTQKQQQQQPNRTVPVPSVALSEPLQPLDVRAAEAPVGGGSRLPVRQNPLPPSLANWPTALSRR